LALGGGSELSRFCSWSSAKALATKNAKAGVIGDSSKNRSFAKVLHSKPRARVEAKNGGDDIRSTVDCDMGSSVQVAGSGRKTRGRVDTGWVGELLGFAQLGLGRVVVGLLEGILVGPKSLSVRNRVRAVLKRLKGSKGFEVGPFSLPISTGHVYRQHKGKSSLKGVGTGRLTKRVRLKPSLRTKVQAVDLGPSSQQVYAGAEPLVPKRGLDEALPLPVLTTDEGCLRASIGDGSSSGAMLFHPASFLAESIRNSTPAMGFLRNGFFGPRTPSTSSSLDCKDAPVKDKGTSALGNGMIHRGFFGSSLLLSRFQW
jgi:hypothetical protein